MGLILQALLKARGVIVVPFYARLLTPADLGVVVMAGALCGLLAPLMSLGLATGFLVQAGGFPDRARMGPAYRSVVVFTLLATLAGTVLFELALGGPARLPGVAALRPYGLAIGLWLAATALRDITLAPAQLRQETGFLAGWNLACEFGGAALAVVLLLSGRGVAGLLWGVAGALTLGVVVGLARSLRSAGAGAGLDFPFLKAALAAGVPMLWVSAGEWSAQTLDRFVLSHYHGAAAVGTYGIAWTVASGLLMVAATLNLVCFPAALQLWHQDAGRLATFLEECLRLAALLLGLFVAGACLLSRWGVTLLAGPRHAEAGVVLPLMVLAFCGVTVIQLLRFAPMIVERRTAHIAACHLAIATASLALDFILIPAAGIKGAAFASLLAQSGGVVMMGKLARRSLPALQWRRPLSAPSLVTALVGPAALHFSVPAGTPIGQAFAAAVTCAAVYLALARLLGAFTGEDLKRLGRLLGF